MGGLSAIFINIFYYSFIIITAAKARSTNDWRI